MHQHMLFSCHDHGGDREVTVRILLLLQVPATGMTVVKVRHKLRMMDMRHNQDHPATDLTHLRERVEDHRQVEVPTHLVDPPAPTDLTGQEDREDQGGQELE